VWRAAGDRVFSVGSTRVEWTAADLGIAHAGAVSPIYQSDTAEEIRYVVQNSSATVVFVEDDKAAQIARSPQSASRRAFASFRGEGGDWRCRLRN
jgi:long-subunit acyl-CoA synthetase (AMP-forming)